MMMMMMVTMMMPAVAILSVYFSKAGKVYNYLPGKELAKPVNLILFTTIRIWMSDSSPYVIIM